MFKARKAEEHRKKLAEQHVRKVEKAKKKAEKERLKRLAEIQKKAEQDKKLAEKKKRAEERLKAKPDPNKKIMNNMHVYENVILVARRGSSNTRITMPVGFSGVRNQDIFLSEPWS